jgi:hypothetical protein
MWTNLIGSIPTHCVFFQHFFTTYTLRFLMKICIKSTFRANWLRTIYSLVLLLGGFQVLFSKTTWDGSVSSNWHDDANWSTGVKPTAADDVVTPDVATDPTVSTAAIDKTVTVNLNAVLAIAAAGSLTTHGSVSASSSRTKAILNQGTMNNSGEIIIGAAISPSIEGLFNNRVLNHLIGGKITGETDENSLPFITTWKTDNPGISNNTSITIPTTGGGYNYDVDWDDDGTYDELGIMGDVTHDFGTAGTYTIRIRGAFPRIYFNGSGDREKLLDISQWGAIAWTSMENAFSSCVNLNISATDAPILSGVTSLRAMFFGCSSLDGPANIGTWNTGTVTDMRSMFFGADLFNQLIGTWNTAAVTDMTSMFFGDESFNQDLGDWVLNASVIMSNMLTSTGMDCSNYSATLIGWANNPVTPSGRSLGASGRKYETAAVAAWDNLTITKGWTIIDAGLVSNTFYADTDGDGFGDASAPSSINTCAPPSGYAANTTDCDDDCAACFPGNPEICDGKDNDCNGMIDDVAACGSAGTRTWTGFVSTDWHTPCNWNPGCVPTADDNVIIPNVTNDPSISAAAVAKNVVVNAGGVLTIAAAGSLAVEGAAMANAISNMGTVNNHGTITIGAVLTAGFNGIRNEGAFTNHPGGQIQVDRAIDAGIANFSSGTFTNEAIITIGGIISPGNSGIANGGIFNNNSAAQIQINRSTLYGLINGGTFNNDGSLTLGANFSIGIHGIFSNGTINNNIDGQIQIDRAGSSSGVFNNVGGSFQNKGDLNIGAIAAGTYGLLNNAAFSNQISGQILIQRANDASILNEGSNVTLDNYGTLTIAANNGGGIRNFSSATIHNRPCGQIFLYKRLNNTATYTNEGLFRVDFGASAHVNTGTLTNNSIIEYPQGNPIPNVVNNEITVAPTTANTCDIINPAFGLGNPVDFTIAGIFTDAAATMSAGTYTTATNTFTPTSVLPEGSYTFYVKIEDDNGGCTRIATWKLTTENCCDAPEAICKSATIALVGNSASLSVSDVNNGSTYECGLQSITVSPNSFSCSQVGTPQTVTLTVTDVKGNSDACQTTVTVRDNTAPTVVCKNFTTNLSTTGTASINTTNVFQSGSDNCGNVTQVSVMPNAFTCANLGANTVVLTVNDGNSNMATCSATVTVVDAIAPTIICPANIVRATDLNQCNAIVNYTTPTIASDNCAGAVASHFSGGVSGAVFQKGATTVIWRATDGAGLIGSCSFSITVNDTQRPNITCPVNQTRSTSPGLCSAVVTYPTPTGTDNCGLPTGQPVWISGGTNAAGSTATFQKGNTTVIWQATDAVGNAQTCSFRVTVNDTQAPTMTCPAAVSLSTATNTCSAVATYTNPTFTDNCAPTTGTSTRISGLVSGSNFPVGNNNVVFQATDAAGNTRRCTMVVTVTDIQPPVVICPQSIVVTGSGTPCTSTAIYANATASDNCAVTLTPFLLTGLASGSVFPAGVTTNTFRAVAPNGQSATCSFTVTVNCGSSGMSNSGLEDRNQDLEAAQMVLQKTNLGLSIAPNPALSAVTVSIEGVGAGGGTLQVFDQIGRLIQQQVIAGDQRTSTLQVAEFAPGLYRICLKTDTGIVTKTLVR